MEESQKIRKITQKEASQINANDIAYYTLTDGTIVHIKREEEGTSGTDQLQNVQQFAGENNFPGAEEQPLVQNQNELDQQYQEIENTTEDNQVIQQEQNIASNEYQEQVKMESQIQNQEQQFLEEGQNINNLALNSNLDNMVQIQNEDNQNILQPGDNYGYYISGQERNIVKPQTQTQPQPQPQLQQQEYCTCNRQISQRAQDLLNYNAYLINAQENDSHINQLGLKNISQLDNPTLQQGPINKRQLYKLVTAVPIIVKDNKYESRYQKMNNQMHLHDYNSNTYTIGKLKHQSEMRRMETDKNYQPHSQLNQYKYGQYMEGPTITQGNQYEDNINLNENIQNQEMEENQYNYQLNDQNQQYQEQEFQYDDDLENIEYCDMDQNYNELTQEQEQKLYNERRTDNYNCICPIGNKAMRRQFRIINPRYILKRRFKNYTFNPNQGY